MINKYNKRVQITMKIVDYKFWKKYCEKINMTLSELIKEELKSKYYNEGLDLDD